MLNNLNYFASLAKTFWNYRKRRIICPHPPLRLYIEPTSVCNLKCTMCLNRFLPREQKGSMDLSLFKEIIDQASSFTYEIYLYSRGESLLHPQVFDMIEHVKRRGLNVRLNTSGTLLTEEKSHRLIKSGLDLLTFSVDGYDKETYEKLRVGADFEETLKNITTFLKIKKDGGHKHPFTVLQTMEFEDRSNDELRRKRRSFLRQFDGLPLDKFDRRQFHNWGGGLQVGGTNDLKTDSRNYIQCSYLWYSLVINWNGTVCPCPRDFMAKMILGDVSKLSLQKIWNCDYIVGLRQAVIRREFKKEHLCAECDKVLQEEKPIFGLPTKYIRGFFKDSPLTYIWHRGAKKGRIG